MSARLPRTAILPLLAAVAVVALAVACSSNDDAGPAPSAATETMSTSAPTGGPAPEDTVVTVYRTSTCGCCIGYIDYLEDQGFRIEDVVVEDLDSVKHDLQVPHEMRSCHTALAGDYFVEGHVPVEAVLTLLRDRPPVDGIALPGMPAGSPGMGGEKAGPFLIYSITDGRAEEFMTV